MGNRLQYELFGGHNTIYFASTNHQACLRLSSRPCGLVLATVVAPRFLTRNLTGLRREAHDGDIRLPGVSLHRSQELALAHLVGLNATAVKPYHLHIVMRAFYSDRPPAPGEVHNERKRKHRRDEPRPGEIRIVFLYLITTLQTSSVLPSA